MPEAQANISYIILSHNFHKIDSYGNDIIKIKSRNHIFTYIILSYNPFMVQAKPLIPEVSR